MSWLCALALFCAIDLQGIDLIARGKLRWSKLDGSERIVVQINGGNAARLNPNWSPDPEKLPYDLDRERELWRVVKAAHLPPAARRSEGPDDRTLEVDVQDAGGEWRRAGAWTLPVKAWRKGRLAAIFTLLEPLLSVRPELYQALPDKEAR
jgi:hypothetical protein